MAINDVLPLKTARRYAIANAKWFLGLRDASDLISMVPFTFAMRRHLIRLASAPYLSPSVWHSLVLFCLLTFVCNASWQRSKTHLQRVLENSGPIFTRLWTKVH